MTWIVKNTLKGTLSFRGLDLSIKAGDEFDLDTRPGRSAAEGSNQVIVAFEEGYLANVFKEPQPSSGPAPRGVATEGVSQAQIDASLDRFKDEVLSEIRSQRSTTEDASSSQLEDVRSSISQDMQELVGELKLVRDRFASVRGRIEVDNNLSEVEIKARLMFLDEQERELMKNFETVGRTVESDDGDVMDKADLLANL
ncbi:MAG: hypothetical protein JKY65_17265 [Planctomycetes bacterium]|nr:hypothetical protein [Planctomycetota bacterium]